MNKTRKRSKNISQEDIAIAVNLLDTWDSKLTWDYLITGLHFKTNKHYTRQALSNHTRIKESFSIAKRRLSKKSGIDMDVEDKSISILEQKNKQLLEENLRLKKENELLLQEIYLLKLNKNISSEY